MLKQNSNITKLISILLLTLYLFIFSAFSFHYHNGFLPEKNIYTKKQQIIFHDRSGFCFLNQLKSFSHYFFPPINFEKSPLIKFEIAAIFGNYFISEPLQKDNLLRAPPCIF